MSFSQHIVFNLYKLYNMVIVIIPHLLSPIPLPLLQLGEREGGVAKVKLIRMYIWGMGLRFI